DGRFQIDAFGGDAQLMDLAGRALALGVRVDVEHAERIPRLGGALVVANRGLGLFEPAALAVAVRQTGGRRLRAIGAPALAAPGDVRGRLGPVGCGPDAVAVWVRAGHLAAAPLARRGLRSGAGAPPRELLAAIVGFPVVPAVVLPGGPGPLPIRPWRVIVGPVVETATPPVPRDTPAGAELAERTPPAVNPPLQGAPGPPGSDSPPVAQW